MPKDILKAQGEQIVKDQKDLAQRMVAFITNSMKEVKDIHTFDNFDKEDGTLNFDDNYECEGVTELIDNAPIISICTFDKTEDMYLVGVRYKENKGDLHTPYVIWVDCVPYDDPCYVRFITLEEVLSEYYIDIVEFIANNL